MKSHQVGSEERGPQESNTWIHIFEVLGWSLIGKASEEDLAFTFPGVQGGWKSSKEGDASPRISEADPKSRVYEAIGRL